MKGAIKLPDEAPPPSCTTPISVGDGDEDGDKEEDEEQSESEHASDVKCANSGACWSSDTTDLDSVLSC